MSRRQPLMRISRATLQALRVWSDADTEALKDLSRKGWTNDEIADRLGFSRTTVQERRDALGLPNCYEARKEST